MLDWSWNLDDAAVKPVTIFGEDVVLYRTEGGTANVLDAYCPHLGAHLGHGGCVLEESIRCPWHGWQWSVDGVNVAIPFSDRTTKRAVIRRWHVREIDGIIIVWFDALGRDPLWEWPGIPEFRDPDGYYVPGDGVPGTFFYGTHPIKPQSPAENTADANHFPFVHGSSAPGELVDWKEDGHYLRGEFAFLFGGDKASTWMTPNGPERGVIESEWWGVGLGVARFRLAGLTTAQLLGVTPVDHDNSLVFSSVASTKEPESMDEPSGRSRQMMEAQVQQIENDFHIWKNQRYVENPLWVGSEERWYVAFRRWVANLYPDLAGDAAPTETAEPTEPLATR